MESGVLAALSSMIEILTTAIVNFASGFGEGLQKLITSVFFTVNAETNVITGISAFGGVVALFAGIAIAIGLSRWVTNLITSFGNN